MERKLRALRQDHEKIRGQYETRKNAAAEKESRSDVRRIKEAEKQLSDVRESVCTAAPVRMPAILLAHRISWQQLTLVAPAPNFRSAVSTRRRSRPCQRSFSLSGTVGVPQSELQSFPASV